MTPYLQDPDVTLYHGDVLDVLGEMETESVDCCVTSPPYWGLRDYGTPGQLGLEPTPEQYVERMVEVFREVRRVLTPHGTVWLNLGDSYSGGFTGRNDEDGLAALDTAAGHALKTLDARKTRRGNGAGGNRRPRPVPVGLKPKDLVGIPWRVAFALQADGWYLRSDIIWAKPNPMPESVTDRPTKAHEYVFLLSKQPRYFFDQEAVREPHSPDGRHKTVHDHLTDRSHPNYDNVGNGNERWHGGRNIRSVWEIPTQPYPEAHFATFPEELARRCIAAGTSERGKCPECGAPWVREVEKEKISTPRYTASYEKAHGVDGRDGERASLRVTTIDWHPTCDVVACPPSMASGYQGPPASEGGQARAPHPTCECGDESGVIGQVGTVAHAPVPCTVLDPFAGSGTTMFVARKLGRRSVGIDLSAEYLALAARRLQQQSLFALDDGAERSPSAERTE